MASVIQCSMARACIVSRDQEKLPEMHSVKLTLHQPWRSIAIQEQPEKQILWNGPGRNGLGGRYRAGSLL